LSSAKTTVILGDSIIQNLQVYELGKETNQRVVMKSFSGAMTQDMKSYIQPTINNAPDKICLHIGTNDVNKLSTHIDEIRIWLADKCLDILAIQETKLDVSNNNSDFYICGYELIRRDKLSDSGGGICSYIKSTIYLSVRTDLNIDELENLSIEICKLNSRPFIVVNWYRPPNSPTGLFSHLENLTARLDLTNIEFFLLGDVNTDMASTNYDNNVCQLTNIADIYGLHQLIS